MKSILSCLALALLTAALPAVAADEGSAALEAIGKLNGIALACQQPALVTRARNSVIAIAPKSRTAGETFEAATSAAFLEHGKGGVCPDAATLAKDLAQAEKRLQAAFPSQ